ncbi:MAG TPA: 50S ribosomal protein L22, partial [Acidimicrobiia bacterium]|nr:50S ribosomal protein L22 [Acidimicrobiia bacterium]
LEVDDARETLRFCERGAADEVLKLLDSAVANAENNQQMPADELFVHRAYADEGPTMKRWRPRARGRGTRIRKRTSHITIVVARFSDEELQRRSRRDSAAGGARRRPSRRPTRRREPAEEHEHDHEHDHDGAAEPDEPIEATEETTETANVKTKKATAKKKTPTKKKAPAKKSAPKADVDDADVPESWTSAGDAADEPSAEESGHHTEPEESGHHTEPEGSE